MSALRTVRQFTAASARLRVCSKSVARLPLLAARPAATRAFSVSARSLQPSTPAATELALKLKEELDFEVEAAKQTTGEDLPEFLANFVEGGVWDIKDTAGNDEVFLTRKFGDENIRVMFSVADLQGMDEEDLLEQEGEEEPTEPPPTELRVTLTISKPTHPGALNADLYCANNAFEVAGWAFYPSARVAQELTIESDFARRTLFSGPVFETLDVGLQDQFKEFLRERGIDEELAAFVPEYATWKEQQEYVSWLKGVESFVAA
ncbi:regulatory protein suaprga1 [Mycena vitilis]|nr:regulatory protein suaprga1 [Mycena vitilis]